MIEVISIIIQLLIITTFCYAPNYLCTLVTRKKNIDFINHIEIGLIFNLFILLILSFTLRSGSNLIYYILSIIFITNAIFLLKNLIKDFKFKNIKINYTTIIFFILFFIFSIDLSNNLKIGWDAQNYWLVKKFVFTNGGDFFDLKNTPRDDYPYLGSFIWHIYSKFSILEFEYFGRLFYIYLFLVSIFSITSIAKIKDVEKVGLILTIVFLIYKIQLFNGYQEILNFSLLILLTKIFYEMFQEKIPIRQIDFKTFYLFILISSIIWIKSESTVLIIIFLSPIFLFGEVNIKIKIIFLLTFIFLLLTKYYIFNLIGLSHEIQKDNYEYFEISNFFEFVNISRAMLVLKYIFFYSLNNIIYILTIFSLCAFLKLEKKNIFIKYIFLMFLISFSFFVAAFLLSSFPLEWVLWTALNRVMFETSGLFIILIPLTYELLKKKKIFNNI